MPYLTPKERLEPSLDGVAARVAGSAETAKTVATPGLGASGGAGARTPEPRPVSSPRRGPTEGARPSARPSPSAGPDPEAEPEEAGPSSRPGLAATISHARRAEARVTVVRPYGSRIRSQVFPLFERAGLTIDPEDVVPPRTADDDAIRMVRASANRVLLVPFHGHRDASGDRVDGLAFLRRLHAASTGFRWKVVMPVSSFARAGVTLSIGRGTVPEELLSQILFLYDDELDDPGQAQRIERHVADVVLDETAAG